MPYVSVERKPNHESWRSATAQHVVVLLFEALMNCMLTVKVHRLEQANKSNISTPVKPELQSVYRQAASSTSLLTDRGMLWLLLAGVIHDV